MKASEDQLCAAFANELQNSEVFVAWLLDRTRFASLAPASFFASNVDAMLFDVCISHEDIAKLCPAFAGS